MTRPDPAFDEWASRWTPYGRLRHAGRATKADAVRLEAERRRRLNVLKWLGVVAFAAVALWLIGGAM